MTHPRTPQWRKSSYSAHEGGECVALADLFGALGIQDTKNPADGHLTVSQDAMAALFAGIRSR